MLFGRPDPRHGHDKAAQFVDRIERAFERRFASDAGIIGVGKNRATNLFAPIVFAEPGHPDKRMALRRALLLVRVPLVIQVVQKPHGFPKIRIRAHLFREKLHRVRHGVTMPPQTFRLDPLMQNPERFFCQHRA